MKVKTVQKVVIEKTVKVKYLTIPKIPMIPGAYAKPRHLDNCPKPLSYLNSFTPKKYIIIVHNNQPIMENIRPLNIEESVVRL
ncbi:MAG: hypothetical protein ACR2NW_05590 [Thermodesulfobacteriota bacterium]